MMMLTEKKADDKQNLIQSTDPSSGVTQANNAPMTLPLKDSLVSAGPSEYSAAPLCVSSTPSQANTPNTAQQMDAKLAPSAYVYTARDPKADFHQTFLKGKPYALGIVLIVTAIVQIGLAIALPVFASSWSVNTGIQFWGPMFYILAGSFSISAQRRPNFSKVRMSLVFSVISCFSSMAGIIVNISDIALYDCETDCSRDHRTAIAIITCLIFLNLLVFCVSASLSSFGCRAMSPDPSKDRLVLVVRNDVVVSKPPPSSSTY